MCGGGGKRDGAAALEQEHRKDKEFLLGISVESIKYKLQFEPTEHVVFRTCRSRNIRLV